MVLMNVDVAIDSAVAIDVDVVDIDNDHVAIDDVACTIDLHHISSHHAIHKYGTIPPTILS